MSKLDFEMSIKRGVAKLNTTFIKMKPLEFYYLNQAGGELTTLGIGPVYTAPLCIQRGHGIGNFFLQSLPLGTPNPVDRDQRRGPRDVAYRR